jgi:Rv2632c-like
MTRAESWLISGGFSIVTDGDVTLATFTLDDVTVAASARRDPHDKHNPDTGADLALARALGKMARRLERRGNGAVRHADWVREQRKARRAILASRLAAPADVKPKKTGGKIGEPECGCGQIHVPPGSAAHDKKKEVK